MRKLGGRGGNTIIETAMLIPVLLLLLVGMAQIAKFTYTYYTLKKTLYGIATYLSTQQGVNFCDPSDPTIAAAINFGLTGSTDGSQPVFVTGLTAGMIQVTPESLDPLSGSPFPFLWCSFAYGFEAAPPDQIVVSIPNGYILQPRIPFLPINAIPLKPMVKVPYVGT